MKVAFFFFFFSTSLVYISNFTSDLVSCFDDGCGIGVRWVTNCEGA